MPYLLPKRHFSKTQRELSIKQAIAGVKNVRLIQSFLVHETGDGRLVQTVGNHSGQHLQMLQPVAGSLSSVFVRRRVVATVRVLKLPCSARHFVLVVENTTRSLSSVNCI